MKKFTTIPAIFSLFILLLTSTASSGQGNSIPKFLKEKQIWEEKLVVLYASEELQHLVKEQLNILYPFINQLHKEKIVVVQIPTALSLSNRLYLQQKLHAQKDRLNIWVLDEKGNLRMSSTKLTTIDQFLRVLDIAQRPDGLARARFLWDD